MAETPAFGLPAASSQPTGAARRMCRIATPPELTVWWIDLDVALEPSEHAALNAAEVARAQRYVQARDGERYRVAHWALRWLAAETLMQRLDEVAVEADLQGRPWLPADPRCHVSLSHSAGQGLVACSHMFPIGVDIEVLRELADADELIAVHGSPAERQTLRDCSDAQRAAMFLAIWTRKEACLKALGLGLSLELGMLDVGAGPESRRVEVHVNGRYRAIEVASLGGLPGSVGAWARLG